ncbi:MAG TPA: hypothetical protein VKS01_03885 [Bryobacteraceae bacterium]|nr:hypothetical protein [Bryobacteraceae bacterium]
MALGALAAAGYFSIRLAAADAEFRQRTPESVERAVEMEPGDTEYLLFRALELDYDGQDSSAALKRAAELNPLNSAPRIRLGLNAEIRGDYATAEKWLQDAASIDRQYEPQWTLANFYFRRRDAAHFWPAMRDALEIGYGDRRPAFELCWNFPAGGGDASTILKQAIPDRRAVLQSYLIYVLEAHQDAVAGAALKYAELGGNRDVLLAAVDALIASERAGEARRVWRAMGLAANGVVFDGDFRGPRLDRGFDWRESDFTGVTYTSLDQPSAALRITLDGREPESCELLSQVVEVEPRASYVLRWEAQLTGLKSPSGMEWRIAGKAAPLESKELRFTATKELEPLTLVYSRPNGETRAEASFELSKVSIEQAR